MYHFDEEGGLLTYSRLKLLTWMKNQRSNEPGITDEFLVSMALDFFDHVTASELISVVGISDPEACVRSLREKGHLIAIRTLIMDRPAGISQYVSFFDYSPTQPAVEGCF